MAVQGYDFAVDQFTIANTRSRHKDTDFISASVAVAGRPTLRASQSLGDLNNGTFSTAMLFKGVPVADNEVAVFSYAIVNSGHTDPTAVEKQLENAVSSLAEKGAQLAATAVGTAIGAELGASIGTAAVPIIGTALGALAGWIVSTAGALLFANCDGPVAAAVHTFSGSQLRAGTHLGNRDHHPGVDSPAGCGSNSDYTVAWSIKVHNFQIAGAILDKWHTLGGEGGFLGSPETDETVPPDGVGRFVHFAGGSIYWSPSTGAFSVHGAIRDKWASLGWERCPFLGYPITDETGCPDGVGRFNHFQNGSVYWTPATAAFSVHGAIRDKWASLGWERCPFLGYPVTDETGCPDGVGRFNHFQNGSIYWTPRTGAFSVHGAIRDKWASLGWERGSLGYPTSDEGDLAGGGRVSNFEHGRICWQPDKGAWIA